jgi:hypothetical protein
MASSLLRTTFIGLCYFFIAPGPERLRYINLLGSTTN